MIVGGENYSGVFAYASGQTSASPASVPSVPVSTAQETRQTNPSYFRSISSVGYGSLAGAYQAMRALETGNSNVAESAAAPSSDQAILSGAGIPAAMAAYEEAITSAAA